MNYAIDALRTKSDSFHTELVPPAMLAAAIQYRMASVPYLDGIRKTIFYGKELPISTRQFFGYSETGATYENISGDLLHALLGIDTEAAELLKLMSNTLGPVDNDKVLDELGDVIWFVNLALFAIGKTWEEVQQHNIDKLRLRFPEKFTEELAQNASEIEGSTNQ